MRRLCVRVTGVLLLMAVLLSAGLIQAQDADSDDADDTIRLIFGGDVMLARNVQFNTLAGEIDPFEHLTPLFAQYDLAVVNLECVISDQGAPHPGKGYTFRADPAMLDYLLEAGVDAVSLANNHAADYGQVAFLDTIERLAEADVHIFGGGMNRQTAYQPYYVRLKDTMIAIIGVNFIETYYFAATDTRPGIAWYDADYLSQVIREAAALADLTIIMPHWGIEYTGRISGTQVTAAQAMIDAGADLILGGHPHHIQPRDTYRGVEIYYSMGNLIFDGPGPNAGWYRGELVEVVIRDAAIVSTRAIPYEVSVYGVPSLLDVPQS